MAESRSRAALILAILCGLAAYSDSLRGPFIFDDIDAILNNPQVNRSTPHADTNAPTTLSGRPILRATFILDYAVGGLHIEVYHITNLLIHFAAGVVLFGIVHRNLTSAHFWGDRFGHSAPWLAGAVSAVWLVHPLNTEAVTYTVQRAESLAGFFYLLVIYFLIRNWRLAAVAACALGLGTKEVVATAPLLALLYDRTFIAGSFAAALKSRALLYLGLGATWIIPIIGIVNGSRTHSIGNLSPLTYAQTQLGVIAHYIALIFWPQNLVLDYYDWPNAHGAAVGLPAIFVAILILLTLVSLWLRPWLGFLGAWFFLILAPSSSFLPIFTEIAAEHRMYLPLIAPVVLLIVGGWAILSRTLAGAWTAAFLLTVILAALAARTFLRNAEYQDPQTIWTDNVQERPNNPRAHFNLGYTLMLSGNTADAAPQFRQALDLASDYYAAAAALGRALIESGHPADAEKFYTDEIPAFPAFAPEAHLQRGRLRFARGDASGAEEDFQSVRHSSGTTP
jgi:tetratricopeptide (TPR) repeat protein